MSDQPRPVWLNREQRDAVCGKVGMQPTDANHTLAYIVDAWDAAPADPVRCVVEVLYDQMIARYPGVQVADVKSTMVALADNAVGVLRALGYEATP